MRRLRLTLWGLIVLVGIVGAFGLLYAPALESRSASRAQYEEAKAELDAVTARRRSLETRVADLRTRVDSVELSARTEYRLVRPGERVEVIATAGE